MTSTFGTGKRGCTWTELRELVPAAFRRPDALISQTGAISTEGTADEKNLDDSETCGIPSAGWDLRVEVCLKWIWVSLLGGKTNYHSSRLA